MNAYSPTSHVRYDGSTFSHDIWGTQLEEPIAQAGESGLAGGVLSVLTTVLWYVLVGAVIGVVARLIVPGRNPIGVLLTILVGAAGAIVGGVIAASVGAGDIVAFVLAVVIAAIAVAALTGARTGRWGRWGGGWRSRRRVM
jgi:uncharacterized membrane protein YeaQ/YmgE (transglycosylase-associated protein family)